MTQQTIIEETSFVVEKIALQKGELLTVVYVCTYVKSLLCLIFQRERERK